MNPLAWLGASAFHTRFNEMSDLRMRIAAAEQRVRELRVEHAATRRKVRETDAMVRSRLARHMREHLPR